MENRILHWNLEGRCTNGEQRLANSPAFCDMPLAELSRETRQRLDHWPARSWLASLGFCESYCFPCAERAGILWDENQEIREACFYRETSWVGMFRKITIMGPVDPASEVVRRVEQIRKPDIVTILRLDVETLSARGIAQPIFRLQRMSDNHRIELPASCPEYLQSLGSATRKHLPYYLRRIKKEWGSEWSVEHRSGPQISRETYRQLLSLNRLRMDKKNRATLWTETLAEHRWGIVRQSGSQMSLSYRGRVVAGTLSFLHGNEAYLAVIAHDPRHDRLNLGNVCLWLTIEHLIGEGKRAYNLLWGNALYKKQFGGSACPLYEVTRFPSPYASAVSSAANLLLLPQAWDLWNRLSRKAVWFFSALRRPASA